MHTRSYYLVNALTMYRLLMSPVLIVLAMNGQFALFRWLLAVSFFTDSIDGVLSRRLKTTSIFGSMLDSIADDLNIVAALTGMIVFMPSFLRQHFVLLAVLAALFLLQVAMSLIRYRRMTGFHTYIAKAAAIMQGIFFVTVFFLDQPSLVLFYTAAGLTIADLAEEILLVIVLKQWRNDVKGLYWVMRKPSAHAQT